MDDRFIRVTLQLASFRSYGTLIATDLLPPQQDIFLFLVDREGSFHCLLNLATVARVAIFVANGTYSRGDCRWIQANVNVRPLHSVNKH